MAENRGGKIWNDGERTFIEVHGRDLRFLFPEMSESSIPPFWQEFPRWARVWYILRLCKKKCEDNNTFNVLLNRPIGAIPNFHFMVCRQQIVRKAIKSQAS